MRPALERIVRDERTVAGLLALGVASSVVMLVLGHPVAAAANAAGVAFGAVIAHRARKAAADGSATPQV